MDWIEQIAEAAVTVYHRGGLPYDDIERAAVVVEALGVEDDLERRIETVANALRDAKALPQHPRTAQARPHGTTRTSPAAGGDGVRAVTDMETARVSPG